MTGHQPGTPDDERRSFASRTPVNDNPDKVVYRRGFVTRHQVSGWRFVMRRIASGVALHDTRMLVDPLRTQSRSVMMGVLLLITGVAGCFVFSLIRPNGSVGNNVVLADRSTAALYVRLGDTLHPVLNLTSARLIAGHAVDPTMVKSADLDDFSRGNTLGISGAPERMVQNSTADADWTVCDAESGPDAGVTVIAGPPDGDGVRAGALPTGEAVLATAGDRTWLLWEGRRSPVDLADRAAVEALGLGTGTPTPRPIATGLFNAIPEAPALSAPVIERAGQTPDYPLPVAAPIGAVVVSYAADHSTLYYAVLGDGLQPITPVLAELLRHADSHGLASPPQLDADTVARLPESRALDTSRYPASPVRLVDAGSSPVSCAHWSKPSGATTSTLTLLSGATLPVPDGVHTVALVGGGVDGVATRVAVAPGTGYFAQTVGQSPASTPSGSLFWIADTGVRYGIDEASDGAGRAKTVEALGLTRPAVPIPWSVLSLFALGPSLSRADALVARDAPAPDDRPGRRVVTESETR